MVSKVNLDQWVFVDTGVTTAVMALMEQMGLLDKTVILHSYLLKQENTDPAREQQLSKWEIILPVRLWNLK